MARSDLEWDESGRDRIGSATEIYQQTVLRQKRVERIVLVSVVLFVAFVGFAAIYGDGVILRSSVQALQSLGRDAGNASRDPGVNCMNPKNKKTRYCLERKAAINADWNQMTRFKGSQANPFSLHGDKNPNRAGGLGERR